MLNKSEKSGLTKMICFIKEKVIVEKNTLFTEELIGRKINKKVIVAKTILILKIVVSNIYLTLLPNLLQAFSFTNSLIY